MNMVLLFCTYSPPSGYLALCSANLPIHRPIETDDDHLVKLCNASYTGNGSSRTVSGLNFQIWLWIKIDANGSRINI